MTLAQNVLHVRASRAQVMRALAALPGIASGRSTVAGGVGPYRQALLTRVGLTALSYVKVAFVQKARGGTDDSGLRWKPLSPYTIAMRRIARATRAKRKKKKGLEGEGALTETLRDTGLLLNSLSPGVPPADAPPPVPPPRSVEEQVFRVMRGEVIIGTNRQWAGTHHKGVPGRIPQRPLWPDPSRWPAPWWDGILNQARLGVVDILAFLLRGTP